MKIAQILKWVNSIHGVRASGDTPTKDWALQVSYGHLINPEALKKEISTEPQHRFLTIVRGLDGNWATTLESGGEIKKTSHVKQLFA